MPFPLHPQQYRVWHWQGHVAALGSGFQWKMAKGHPHLGAAVQQCMHQDTPAKARTCPHRSSCCTAVCDRATAASATATTSTTTTAADADTGAPITTTTTRAVYPWGGREGGEAHNTDVTTTTTTTPFPYAMCTTPLKLDSECTTALVRAQRLQRTCSASTGPCAPSRTGGPRGTAGPGGPLRPTPCTIDRHTAFQQSINQSCIRKHDCV